MIGITSTAKGKGLNKSPKTALSPTFQPPHLPSPCRANTKPPSPIGTSRSSHLSPETNIKSQNQLIYRNLKECRCKPQNSPVWLVQGAAIYINIAAPCTTEIHTENQHFTLLVKPRVQPRFLHRLLILCFSCNPVIPKNKKSPKHFPFLVKIPIFASVPRAERSNAAKPAPLPNRYRLPNFLLFKSYLPTDYKKTIVFLQKRECKGNTRKFYFKALRAVLNKAIQDGEASESAYPFGKGGFSVASLEEETMKRYLPHEDMEKLKNTVVESAAQELARRLFLFSYYCYGISFIDAALLTKKNIIRYNGGNYIVYKRNKTKEAKRVKPIQIRITQEIQNLLDWFSANTLLVEDYLLPIVSIAGYKGERLYNHIRSRFGRNNKNLANLAKVLEITDMKLTSYVSRHTMAMTLQDNQVPREVISQILGHSDLATTNTYLDSFASSVIDEAVKVL